MVRPLPGIRFQTVTPPLGDVLPRMDVAVFVGLAASGPVEIPVAVEDAVQFGEIFGDLARAHLGASVRAFFRNGGRRCWIVRVSPGATRNRFPIPGLFEVQDNGSLKQAYAWARSEGAWSNTLTVSSALAVETMELVSADLPELEIAVGRRSTLQAGDLLRLGGALLVTVRSVSEPVAGVVTVTTGFEYWSASPPPELTRVERLSFELRAGGVRLDGLAFAPRHPRYWAGLPSDRELFTAEALVTGLAAEAASPRFPLAGPGVGLFLPIGMPFLVSDPVGPEGTATDGSIEFDDRLFLDSRLAETGTLDLMNEADYIRYQSPSPDRLHGIHAALEVDEATIIAVPDAVLSGWKYVEQVFPLPSPAPTVGQVEALPYVFRDCDAKVDPPPAAPPPVPEFYTTVTSHFSDGALMRIQQALLRMCAARGDLFAILGVPASYREAELLTHAGKLTESETLSYGGLYHPWLTGREENSLDRLRTSPPDGAIAGTMAKRALLRGAWIAPAGEALHGVVALEPKVRREYWQAIQDAQVNLIRQEPSGFFCLNSDTLSQDEDLRPINVRRLLQLLRRAALRLGANYVFEPNDAPFRRSVQRGFEAMLDGMFLRGAFAGRVAAEGFQVVTDSSLNTRVSIDQGRFIVEIRVAPSLPLTFLTVRLVQAADRTFVTEGR